MNGDYYRAALDVVNSYFLVQGKLMHTRLEL